MIPKRPFLLRAFYDWIVESNMTPHILVNTDAAEVTVPKQHIKDGKIVLNVSPMAIQDFMMDNEALSFSARFGGVSFYIYCPMYAIEAVYARESPTDGISFAPDEYAEANALSDQQKSAAPVAVLSAVDSKQLDNNAEPEAETAELEGQADADLSEVDDQPEEEAPPPRKRPSLRVVK